MKGSALGTRSEDHDHQTQDRSPGLCSPEAIQEPAIHNGQLAELLARHAEEVSGHLQRALRRAARAAFLWPIEATELVASDRSLTELPAVGPHLARILLRWIDEGQVLPPPAIRQDFLTLTQAKRILAHDPRWTARYRGDLQMHSTWSDGAGTIEEMAAAGAARGYEYIAITDHSQGLKIAGGINAADLDAQAVEIRRAEESFCTAGQPIRILRSLELNLNPAGEGDMPPGSLRRLDLVVGSFHSALRKTDDQTHRYLAALRNPDVQILGHPRGRIYNHRLGLTANWQQVLAQAAKLDKAVEIDSYPDRQDLNVELLLLAKEAGVRLAIDTDAHAPAQLGFVELGLAAALLAGIDPERIINFMSPKKLLAWAGELRSGA